MVKKLVIDGKLKGVLLVRDDSCGVAFCPSTDRPPGHLQAVQNISRGTAIGWDTDSFYFGSSEEVRRFARRLLKIVEKA